MSLDTINITHICRSMPEKHFLVNKCKTASTCVHLRVTKYNEVFTINKANHA